AVTFTFEVDENGDGTWSHLEEVSVPVHSEIEYVFTEDQSGEWVRVHVDRVTRATVHFTYNDVDKRGNEADGIFDGLSNVKEDKSYGGLLYGLGDDKRAMGVLAGKWNDNSFTESGYYELDGEMNLFRKEDSATIRFMQNKF